MSVDQFKLDPRIAFAAERTLLAWVRTGLGSMGFGAVVTRLALPGEGAAPSTDLPVEAVATGTALMALGVFVSVVGAVRYRRVMHRLRAGLELDPHDERALIAVALAFAALGVVLMVGLLRLL